MAKQIDVSYQGTFCYRIILEQDFSRLPDEIHALNYDTSRKICIVTDSNLAACHLTALQDVLGQVFSQVISFVFPAGEQSKNLNTVQDLYEKLILNHFDRHDVLVAFGGGVVGDLTGFAAATYLRGIDFIQIPTSLLSQVDSSIGGKTGVDFSRYKNMVGAFYQPRLVYMNLSLLQTLPPEQFVSGMGEIVKHGLIKSRPYFMWMRENSEKIQALDPDALEEMICQSCLIKRDVVERDPKEKGERALLNFGHTIGHSVEKLADFRLYHGHCVGIGMAAACKISQDLGEISSEDVALILDTLHRFHLPVSVEGLKEDDILAVSRSDKKMLAGKIRFILLHGIGEAYINPDLTEEQIRSGIRAIIK